MLKFVLLIKKVKQLKIKNMAGNDQQKYVPINTIGLDVQTFDLFTENSMRESAEITNLTRQIDVKTRAQGIVLSVPFNKVRNVKVKLINTDLPDLVYYDLKGFELQKVLQEVYGDSSDISVNENQYAIIPFSAFGYFDLDENQYMQVLIELTDDVSVRFDKIVDYTPARNPLTVKALTDVKEFDSSKFDIAMFFNDNDIVDVRLTHNGQGVNFPQSIFRNQKSIKGYASLKLIPDTNYFLSQSTNVFLVDY